MGSPAPVATSGWLVWGPLSRSRFLSVVWAPLCLLPGCLEGGSWFLLSGLFPFCWLLSGAPGSSPSFPSPRPRSLSLSALLAPASRPWGYSWLAPVSVLATFVARIVPRHLLVASLLVSLCFCEVIFRFALSHLPGGVQLFCFPLAPFQSVLLVYPGCWLVFLALSSAFRQVIDRRLLSSLWFGWCFCYLPCGPTPGLSLAYWLFHRSSLGARCCVLSLTLGFSIPLPVSSSWAPLSRFLSSSASSSPRYSLWLLDPAFLFLLCASSSSLLAACLLFLFLGTAFPGTWYVPMFSLLFLWP